MAVLSKIRERSLFLIIIIGLALFAFVLDPSTLGDFFNSSKINEVGSVNGETISRQEFAEAIENYQAQTNSRSSEMQASKLVWDNLVREKLYKAQLEEAGITIGEQDIMNNLYESPSVQSDPRFQSGGVFDKEKFKEFLATNKAEDNETWKLWNNYITSLGNNLRRRTYDNLVGAGLGATLKEGHLQYLIENTNIYAQYVYVPYTSIADSLISVSKSDVERYISNHSNEFKTEATRDINYVRFAIEATPEDKEAIKNDVATLIEDSKDRYDKVVKGLKNTTDYETFLEENKSDLSFDDNFKFKSDLFVEVAEDIFSKNVGEVFGPYEDRGFYKASKITAIAQMPDSVKASHILIPFLGSRGADADTKLEEEAAKKQADSILAVVKRNKNKFSDLAKQFSSDKSNSEKGGALDWFNYRRMVPEFRDYCFENKTGDMGVVKTAFGFHVIKIDGQKNKQKVVKLATLARKIVPSEATENAVFQKAEQFSLDVSKGKSFSDVAKESDVQVRSAVSMKALDENVPGLGNQRQIISWAFSEDVEKGSIKRFDLDNSHIVAVVSYVGKKGLLPAEKATSRVRPILVKQKKAKQIIDKMSGSTLTDISKNFNETVKNVNGVNLGSPTISGVGNEPKVVGAMSYAKENELYSKIEGDKGVFAFVVTKKEKPTELTSYNPYRQRIANSRRNQNSKMYEAIKSASDLEDNRAFFYGVEE